MLPGARVPGTRGLPLLLPLLVASCLPVPPSQFYQETPTLAPSPSPEPSLTPVVTPTEAPTPTPLPDLDGDGYSVAEGDCDDTDPDRSPGLHLDWLEDGVDNNCDGTVDGTSSLAEAVSVGGAQSGERLGSRLATADLDGDGKLDLLLGAPLADFDGLTDGGAVYIFYGPLEALSQPLTVANADARILGEKALSQLGGSLSAAQDMDGDGLPELLLGAPYYSEAVNNQEGGRAYLFYSSEGERLLGEYPVSSADVVFKPQAAFNHLGIGLALLPDITGDGLGELALGAPGYSSSPTKASCGRLYVFWGNHDRLGQVTSVQNGLVLEGRAGKDELGTAVVAAADFTGDGIPDLVVGAPGMDGDGGQDNGGLLGYYKSSGGGLLGFATWLGSPGEKVGSALEPALEGTGQRSGLWVGSREADQEGVENGGSLYYLPGDTVVSGDRVLADAPLQIVGGQPNWRIGGPGSFASLGDLDGDQVTELVVGAVQASGAGCVHLLEPFALQARLSPAVTILDLSQSLATLCGMGQDEAGLAVAPLPADASSSYDGFVVGAPGTEVSDRAQAGAAYVVHGNPRAIH